MKTFISKKKDVRKSKKSSSIFDGVKGYNTTYYSYSPYQAIICLK